MVYNPYGFPTGAATNPAVQLEQAKQRERERVQQMQPEAFQPPERIDPTQLMHSGMLEEPPLEELPPAPGAEADPLSMEQQLAYKTQGLYVPDSETLQALKVIGQNVQSSQERIAARQQEQQESAQALQDWQEDQVLSQQELQNKKEEALQAQHKRIEQAMVAAKYPNMDPGEALRLQQMVDSGVDEQGEEVPQFVVNEARQRLQGAQQIGDQRSMKQRVLSALVIGLGTLASSYTGKPNYALQLINKQIERDIQQQREASEGKRREYGRQINLYNHMKSKFDDEIAAQSTAMAQRKQQAAEEIALNQQQISNEQVQVQMEKVKASLLSEAETLRMKAADRLMNLELAQQRAQQQEEKNQPDWVPVGVTVVEGKVPPTGVRDQRDVREAIQGAEEIIDLSDQMIALRRDAGAEALERWTVANAQMLAARARNVMRKVGGMGAHLSANEVKMLNAMMSEDPTRIGFEMSKLKNFRAQMIRAAKLKLRPYNLQWSPGWLEEGQFLGAAGVGQAGLPGSAQVVETVD